MVNTAAGQPEPFSSYDFTFTFYLCLYYLLQVQGIRGVTGSYIDVTLMDIFNSIFIMSTSMSEWYERLIACIWSFSLNKLWHSSIRKSISQSCFTCMAWYFTCQSSESGSHWTRLSRQWGQIDYGEICRASNLVPVFSETLGPVSEVCRASYSVPVCSYTLGPVSEVCRASYSGPVCSYTLGPVSEEATCFLQELGRRIVVVTLESQTMSFLWRRLSNIVHRGNVACV